jgi:hypothetical protein
MAGCRSANWHLLVSKYGFSDVRRPRRPRPVPGCRTGCVGHRVHRRRPDIRPARRRAGPHHGRGLGSPPLWAWPPGAGLWLLAILVTVGHYAVVFGLAPLAAKLPRSRFAPSRLRLVYLDGHGALGPRSRSAPHAVSQLPRRRSTSRTPITTRAQSCSGSPLRDEAPFLT